MATGVVIRPTIRKIRAKIASQHARSKRSEVVRSIRATVIVQSAVSEQSLFNITTPQLRCFSPCWLTMLLPASQQFVDRRKHQQSHCRCGDQAADHYTGKWPLYFSTDPMR